MADKYYIVEVYLPHPIQDSTLVENLRKQWSMAFGGTTSYTAEGTYLADSPETVTIIKLLIPNTFLQAEIIDYFCKRV